MSGPNAFLENKKSAYHCLVLLLFLYTVCVHSLGKNTLNKWQSTLYLRNGSVVYQALLMKPHTGLP